MERTCLISNVGRALLGGLGGLSVLLAISATAAPPRSVQNEPAIVPSKPKEHWLTIVIDPLDTHMAGSPLPASAGAKEAVESELSAQPSASPVMTCGVWMIWFPVSVQTPWSEIDPSGTSIASVKRGKDGIIDAVPLRAADGESNARRWYWGPDRRGPEGLSDWRMLVNGPPCDCCDPDCKLPDNGDIAERGIGIELHARSHQPRVNWKVAIALPWMEPGSALAPFLASAPYIETDSAAVQTFARHWAGNNPRANSPWITALTLARAASARAAPKAFREHPPAAVRGVRVAGASAFASSGTGNVHDAHCLAVAAMRSVGIPARVVLGFQVEEREGAFTQAAELTTWGEFWIGAAGWVPFDCGEMRSDSAGNPPPTAEIDGFGSPSNHNMRVAWSWYFDAPFRRAGKREFPAGFSIGPVYDTIEALAADWSKTNIPPAKLQATFDAQADRARLLSTMGTLGATARGNRSSPSKWPGFEGKR